MTLDALLNFFCELIQKVENARVDVERRRQLAERQAKQKEIQEARKVSSKCYFIFESW